MIQTSPWLKVVRSGIFLLTVGYFVILSLDANWSQVGGNLRFLTHWGLAASSVSAFFMLCLSMGWSQNRHEVFASVTVVLNLTVLLMYWKIYFEDPALFYGPDGSPAPWYEEYFLHGLGPLMQIFDALFLLGAFTQMRRVVPAVVALPIIYLFWAEFVLRPLNDSPAGSVVSGLPYRFLNNMEATERIGFYMTTVITMLVLMGLAWAAAALIRGVRSRGISTYSQ